MKNMKLYILNMGESTVNSIYTVCDDTFATVADPHAPHRMLHTPSIAVLIDHPDAGWILYDTGLPDYPGQAWLPRHLEGVSYTKPEETFMVNQLALLGLKPEDIKHVILSHMHMDHTGNNHLFAKTADFYVAEEEANLAFRTVIQSTDTDSWGWYIKDELILPYKKLSYIRKDAELFPGVELIRLPGHTPCVLGLVAHLDGGTIIFPDDAISEHRNYEGHMPCAPYDSLGYIASIEKVQELEKKYKAQVFFSHDLAQITAMKKAPEYYE